MEMEMMMMMMMMKTTVRSVPDGSDNQNYAATFFKHKWGLVLSVGVHLYSVAQLLLSQYRLLNLLNDTH